MGFLPIDQLEELKYFAELADRETRSDLAIGNIHSENEYTSVFVAALRRNINSYSESGLRASSVTLRPTVEREIGADASIILSLGNLSKVAVFESKWPKFEDVGYKWDYEQTSSGLSHFTDQLLRQKKWCDRFAVFEMFYNEAPLGARTRYLNRYGSSCVWHKDAVEFMRMKPNPEELWTQKDLRSLISSKGLGISSILEKFGDCSQGSPLMGTDAKEIWQEFSLPDQILQVTAE